MRKGKQRIEDGEMLKTGLVVVSVGLALATAPSLAQTSSQDVLGELERRRHAAQLEIDVSRLEAKQAEADAARRQAEMDRLIADTDRLRMWRKSVEAADHSRETTERAEQAAREQAEAAQKAEDAAESLRAEMTRSSVRNANSVYLGVLVVLTVGFVAYLIGQSKKEGEMRPNQKFGIAMIVGSGLFAFLAVVLSEGWVYQFDFIQNLMSALRIKFFADEGGFNAYLVDVPTKYVVLVCISLAA